MNSGRILILKTDNDIVELNEVRTIDDIVISIGMPNLEVAEDIFLTDLFIQQVMSPKQVLLLGDAKNETDSKRLFLYLTFRHPTALLAWSEFYNLSYDTMQVGPRSTIKELAEAFAESKINLECEIMREMLS